MSPTSSHSEEGKREDRRRPARSLPGVGSRQDYDECCLPASSKDIVTSAEDGNADEAQADAGPLDAANANAPLDPGPDAKPDGTGTNRNAAAENTIGSGRVRSSPVARRVGPHNRQTLSLGAGPRAAPSTLAAQLRPAPLPRPPLGQPPSQPAARWRPGTLHARPEAGAADDLGSGDFDSDAAPDLGACPDNAAPTATTAIAWPSAGKPGCNTEPAAVPAGRSVHNPSAGNAADG